MHLVNMLCRAALSLVEGESSTRVNVPGKTREPSEAYLTCLFDSL